MVGRGHVAEQTRPPPPGLSRSPLSRVKPLKGQLDDLNRRDSQAGVDKKERVLVTDRHQTHAEELTINLARHRHQRE